MGRGFKPHQPYPVMSRDIENTPVFGPGCFLVVAAFRLVLCMMLLVGNIGETGFTAPDH